MPVVRQPRGGEDEQSWTDRLKGRAVYLADMLKKINRVGGEVVVGGLIGVMRQLGYNPLRMLGRALISGIGGALRGLWKGTKTEFWAARRRRDINLRVAEHKYMAAAADAGYAMSPKLAKALAWATV